MHTYIQPKRTNYETDEEFFEAVKMIMEKYPESSETLNKCLGFIREDEGGRIESTILGDLIELFKIAENDSEEIMRINNFMIDNIEEWEEEMCDKHIEYLLSFEKIFIPNR